MRFKDRYLLLNITFEMSVVGFSATMGRNGYLNVNLTDNQQMDPVPHTRSIDH